MEGEAFLLLEKNFVKVYGPVPTNNVNATLRFFKSQGFRATVIPPPPSLEVLREWNKKREGCALDGCVTEGWESCQHGSRSWLWIFKEIKYE